MFFTHTVINWQRNMQFFLSFCVYFKNGFFCISAYVLLNFKGKTLTLNNNKSRGILEKCILEMYGTVKMNNNIYMTSNVRYMLFFEGSRVSYIKARMLYDKINLLHI